MLTTFYTITHAHFVFEKVQILDHSYPLEQEVIGNHPLYQKLQNENNTNKNKQTKKCSSVFSEL